MRKFLRITFYLLQPKSFKNLYKYFFKNPTLLYYPYVGKHTKNIGDAINPFLFENITNREIINSNSILNILNKDKFFFIGSVLDQIDNNSIVVGAGFISEDSPVKAPKSIYAVRGPLTRAKFISNNIRCPKIYCDPGLLVSRVFKFHKQKKYKYGLVPHYVDFDNLVLSKVKDNLEFKILNVHDNHEIFLEELNQCEFIFSSSLHGIIFAISYSIPCVWIKFSNKIYGEDFKFRDFYASLNLKIEPCESMLIIDDIKSLVNKAIVVDTSTQQDNLMSILKKLK